MAEESRSALYAQFIETFADRSATRSAVSEKDLGELERLLGTRVPASYAQFMRQHGPVYCPTILRLTMACELEHPDLRQILSPPQVVQRSRHFWRQHLPVDLYVFASDCMGNGFCFRQSKTAQDDAEVLFLAREREGGTGLGETFDEMLRSYVEHLRQVAEPAAFQ